ncbi:hypothetical protein PACTADRAFT_48015 [Pachysolen tannophilus NRRL Y-2460]|uniref:Uncharacterized protein n=1 Tax=Pachysolen tannophilus NRRL Y-2460 TaxID=669874 RepID=A0A1E4U2J5_PACTA|nr:hypothetical protein PACTADRAFT_48015 [Pachysolen tannophilus NRRL Y-2460]
MNETAQQQRQQEIVEISSDSGSDSELEIVEVRNENGSGSRSNAASNNRFNVADRIRRKEQLRAQQLREQRTRNNNNNNNNNSELNSSAQDVIEIHSDIENEDTDVQITGEGPGRPLQRRQSSLQPDQQQHQHQQFTPIYLPTGIIRIAENVDRSTTSFANMAPRPDQNVSYISEEERQRRRAAVQRHSALIQAQIHRRQLQQARQHQRLQQAREYSQQPRFGRGGVIVVPSSRGRRRSSRSRNNNGSSNTENMDGFQYEYEYDSEEDPDYVEGGVNPYIYHHLAVFPRMFHGFGRVNPGDDQRIMDQIRRSEEEIQDKRVSERMKHANSYKEKLETKKITKDEKLHGFTDSISEEQDLICVLCGISLGKGIPKDFKPISTSENNDSKDLLIKSIDDNHVSYPWQFHNRTFTDDEIELSKKVFFTKCGHVYCGRCTDMISKNSKGNGLAKKRQKTEIISVILNKEEEIRENFLINANGTAIIPKRCCGYNCGKRLTQFSEIYF